MRFQGNELRWRRPAWLAALPPMMSCIDEPTPVPDTFGPLLPALAWMSCLAGGLFAAIVLLGQFILRLRPVRLRPAVGIAWLAVSLLHSGAWLLVNRLGL